MEIMSGSKVLTHLSGAPSPDMAANLPVLTFTFPVQESKFPVPWSREFDRQTFEPAP